jgi:hypothetical protein
MRELTNSQHLPKADISTLLKPDILTLQRRSCIGIQFSFAQQSATTNCTCPVPMSPRMRFPSRCRMRSPGSAPVSSHNSVRGSSVTMRWSGIIRKSESITILLKCLVFGKPVTWVPGAAHGAVLTKTDSKTSRTAEQ